ncbi:hypothetical protein BGZ54_009811 [Gamsiella multidivaricata]|nr:hypothetical protein BGZ54_009811 [Gamsiella multidivaricata]
MANVPPPPMPQHPFYHNMGPSPPHMGQMMPGFGYSQPGIDQHQDYMHRMMQCGPPIGQFPPGPPPQSRPPPQGHALASLLQSLNQPSAISPTNTSAPTFSAQHQQPLPQAHTPPSQAGLQADLQASTEGLKLALFGPPKQDAPITAQQKTEDLKLALFKGSRPDLAQLQPSPKKEEVNFLAMLQKSSSASSPVPQTDIKMEGTTDVKSAESIGESSTKSPAAKESTSQSNSRAKFTYVNPFHSFTSTASAANASNTASATPAAPSASAAAATAATTTGNATSPSNTRTSTPTAPSQDIVAPGTSSKRSSFSAPAPRRETPTHAEVDGSNHPHDDQKRYQLDQLLPPHSAWNHRVQKLAKGSLSIPDGVYLSHPRSAITTYDIGLDNLDAIFSEDLETTPITLIPTDVEYNHGRMVAVSKGYISYAAKGGKIRVIQQSHGHRTLLRGHTDQVIDMGFSSAAHDASKMQLLASVGKDSRLIIWDLSGSDTDSTDIVHSKYMELLGAPRSDQPRYTRIAWSPVHPSQLALVNNDDHSVLIVNIHNLVKSQVGDSPVMSEAQLLTHSLVIRAHDQTINDISFSRDGSVVATASEDGSVKFWDLKTSTLEPTLLNEFVPHGGLGVTNAIFVDQPGATILRCVVTACRRGTELSLWHVAGTDPLDQLVFKEPPSSSRRSSVGKSALRLQEMRMFNIMGYDHETSSLVLANSARLSLFGLQIKVTSASVNSVSTKDQDQAAYIRAAAATEETPCTATFDFMIEYPMPQPVVSFVVMPDSSLEYNGFSVYCIQTKAVQQYTIKGLEPHDKHKCQTFVSAPPANKPAESRPKANARTNMPKSSSSPSVKGNDGADSSAVFKAEKNVSDSNAATPAVSAETQDKEQEKSLKLHGPVINGAIAKLKEKKRNSAADNQAHAEGSDKKESPKVPVSGRMGRKGSQDLSTQQEGVSARKGQSASTETKPSAETAKLIGRNTRQLSNRHQEATEPIPLLEQTPSTLSGGYVSISMGDLQSVLQSMEDRMASRFEKRLSVELEQQYRRMDQDQISRQEVVLKMVSQTLAKNTEQLLVQTVHKEIQNSVVPSLNKIVGTAVERQLARTINDATAKALPSAVEAAVSENVERLMGNPAFVTDLTTQIASTIRPTLEDSFKDSFTKILIPSYQRATQAMFQQIHAAFQSGIEDLASASSKDHDLIKALTSSVHKIASTVDNIQADLAQVVQAQPDQFSGSQPRFDQQRRSVASGLQRALQGDDVSGHPGYASRRASQQPSPVESKQTAAINQLIAYGDFEGAFTQALSTNESSVVFHVCTKVSPRAVFQQTSANPSGSLSQPVLLALAHHLANEQLGQNLGIKLTWLQEVLMRLDPKDPVVGDHMARILPTVQRRLEDTYADLVSSGEASPHIHTLQLLIRYLVNLSS